MAGRNRRERRELTPSEHERAHGLMEQYIRLAKYVARQCWRKYELWDGFTFVDVLATANVGLCEGARDYVEQGFEPTKEREKAYLARAIANEIVDYVRHNGRVYFAKKQAERGGMPEGDRTHWLAPLEEYAEQEEEQAEFMPEEEAHECRLPLDVLRDFSKTLPEQERAVHNEMLKDIASGRYRTDAETAAACGISRSHFYMLLRSIREHLKAWHLWEYHGRAA